MKVLIIDDDDGIRIILSKQLERLGHEADEADDGETGLVKIKNNKYDLIITDLMMNRMNGDELLRNIKDIDIPKVVLTGCNSHDEIVKSVGGLCDKIIYKPWKIKQIEKILESL